MGISDGRDRTCGQCRKGVSSGDIGALRAWSAEEDRRQARIRHTLHRGGGSRGAFDGGRKKPNGEVKSLSPRAVFDVLVPDQIPAELPEAHGDDSKEDDDENDCGSFIRSDTEQVMLLSTDLQRQSRPARDQSSSSR